MVALSNCNTCIGRRDLVKTGLGGVALGATASVGMGPMWAQVAAAQALNPGKILVIVELSGGNDGLNTVIPYTDDAYYKERPKLGIRPNRLIKIDDKFGFQNTMSGMERLWKDGKLAIVHGVGYDQPSLSHFSSMAYWHTAAPNSGETYGWLGRLADATDNSADPNYLVNIDARQSLAVRAKDHVPLVFDDPDKFARSGYDNEKGALKKLSLRKGGSNAAESFMFDVAHSAQAAEVRVRDAWNKYSTPVDYGLVRFGLDRVAALISAGFSTKIFYVAYRNNSFDTHVYQADVHNRLWTYTSDHIAAFIKDIDRIGRGNDVVLMAFSEFGRRVPENTSLGTDHGTAGPMFVAGKTVKGGHYGTVPSLTDLDDGNLKFTVDFRRVYATMIKDHMGFKDAKAVLRGEFETFKMLA